ncbi:peptide ABC transporter permease [Novosphingobium sp. PY1]|nr:peptide ABC transporter permease [Novosphingobium sp. PY1]
MSDVHTFGRDQFAFVGEAKSPGVPLNQFDTHPSFQCAQALGHCRRRYVETARCLGQGGRGCEELEEEEILVRQH